MAIVLLRQTLIMSFYMLAGYALYRWGKLTQEGSRGIASLLVNLVIPVVIVKSFCVEYSAERLAALGDSALTALLVQLLAILIARLIYKKSPIDNFSAAFSNAGFIGIPLVTSVLGVDAVFYLVPMVVLLNLGQWTYGIAIMTEDTSKLKPNALLFNPFVIATVIGLVILMTGLGNHLSAVVSSIIDGISAVNSPLAMIVLGVYLAQVDIGSMVRDYKPYAVSVVRLLLIPAASLLLLAALPLNLVIRQTILIAAAAPVGANVAIYAQLYKKDYAYACQTVVMSTLLSIVTLPAVMAVAEVLLHG